MYENLTQEQLIEKLTERDTLIATMQADAKETQSCVDTTQAELDSFKNENSELLKKLEAQTEELKKTKELNFALGRQVARENGAVDIDEQLHKLFGRKEK